MLDRHAVRKLLDAGVKPGAIAEQFRVSRRTIERIAREAEIRSRVDGVLEREGEGARRSVGRPPVTTAIRARVQALVVDDPDCPPGEICRLLRAEEKANQLAVKMLVPLGLFIFPVVLIVGILPVMIKLLKMIGTG